MVSKKELKAIYANEVDTYEKVCLASKELLKNALHADGIELLQVSHRVKSFESFYEKISRKNYADPYKDTEDLCGIRVICFYTNDLPRVGDIVSKTFELQNQIDRVFDADTDRFGYRSNHYIVTLPDKNEFAPLLGYKIEVQTRTALMHTWAHIQGKLEYKKAEHTPRIFRRKLFQLSALLELADEQFQSLKIEKNLFRASLVSSRSEITPNTEFNIDTFMAFMEHYFPERRESYRYSKLLMIQLINCQLNFSHLIAGYETVENYFDAIEADTGKKFSREDFMKLILAITNEQFYSMYKSDELLVMNKTTIQKWKKKLRN